MKYYFIINFYTEFVFVISFVVNKYKKYEKCDRNYFYEN